MNYLVTYDARPMASISQYVCKVKKYLQSGFKLECVEDDPEKVEKFEKNYGDVIFKRDGTAKGWNTLYWSRYIEPTAIAQAKPEAVNGS